MKRERYEKRLFRVFAQAGYSPSRILTVTPEQMVEIPNITVPNIRTVLFIQKKLAGERDAIRRALMIEEFLRLADYGGKQHGC